MVLSYAKNLVGKAKEKLGIGSSNDFEQVDSAVDSIFEQENEINQKFEDINEKYELKAERAYEKMLEPGEESYSLEDEEIDVSGVQVNRGVEGLTKGLFSESDTINIGADNLLDYVNELGEKITARESEIERSEAALKEFGSETVGELLGAEEADTYAQSVVQSANAKSILDTKNSQLEAETNALKEELSGAVEQYTQQIYDDARKLSEQLGGTARANEGEFDILRNIADSRQNLLEKTHNNTLIDRSSAIKTSGEAISAQSKLVKQYLDKLDSYQESMEKLVNTATPYLDDQNLSNASERAEAMKQGLEGLSNVVNENNYETVEEALTDTVNKGLTPEETSPEHYFNDKNPSKTDKDPKPVAPQ
ncbi:hypothetical protein [Candidatus Nanohalobium constans]|uniref:Uncharacterized protein n=1 Tax=Candidatus Nanohalobium constans TaxID=2565781 RepID=A0A5Q0UG36_9ARCH|nr:hypothetical protein [Candidatus Nanohalobium constans]QGA79925.1 hypothetical protein LC1Nh_0016 [Candidatus Nanohalobium constans]